MLIQPLGRWASKEIIGGPYISLWFLFATSLYAVCFTLVFIWPFVKAAF